MTRRQVRTVFLLALSLFLVSGCSRPAVRFIPDGGSYTLPQAERKALAVDLGRVTQMSSSQAEAQRRLALASLRREGREGSAAADLLTSRFPTKSSDVPAYVEVARVDQKDALLVVDAVPGANGRLSSKRLWVFDRRTGDVILSTRMR